MNNAQMAKIAPYYKAFSGAIIALLTGILGGLASGGLDTSEWITAVVAALTVGGTVFTVPNIIPGTAHTPGLTPPTETPTTPPVR